MTRFLCVLLMCCATIAPAQESTGSAAPGLFARENLAAWCIVPFDGRKRGPEARAAMLEKLGLKKFVYDYRAEHIPQWDDELAALKKHRIELLGWWFPGSLNDEARAALALFKRHQVKPQLWVTGNGGSIPAKDASDQQARINAESARLKPICAAAAETGCSVGLYNHGGWFGEPENQVAIVEALKAQGVANVGIVYNLHHGHEHLARLDQALKLMLPHLLCVNLNGMDVDGDKLGRKILPLGVGSEDVRVLRIVRDSGYRGPIGVLNHTDEDAEGRLLDNLDGLAWLLPQLDGKSPGEKPLLRTRVPEAKTAAAPVAGQAPAYLVEARPEFQNPPLWLELRATLSSRESYNILVASSSKSSPAHWEVFTMPGSGWLTAYLPGAAPDHVRTSIDAADGQPHEIAMHYEATRVRMYVDGRLAAEQAIMLKPHTAAPERLAIGRLVEGDLACRGSIDFVHLLKGEEDGSPRGVEAKEYPTVEDKTLALWKLHGAEGDATDLSSRQLIAKRQRPGTAGGPPMPSPGPHLSAVDPRLQVALVDRSERDVYMGVKVDRDGRLFVGGRERVFLFAPQGRGFAPRHELLKFPPDSIIIGLEFRGDDLYVLTDNALYLVPGGRVRTKDLQPQRILWGLPLDLHVSFHCLAWGPEGKLYLTHGDPLLGFGDWNRPDHWGHWTLFSGVENKPVPYTGQGAVLRVDPDGTNVEVIARGLRGPVGLTFDEHGNL
ncbi:MAG TPA: LamG-like jellyroll fold domain-containing protein, partial [Pirellulales bacterium]